MSADPTGQLAKLREHRGAVPFAAQQAIATRHKMPPREVARLFGEVRREGIAAA